MSGRKIQARVEDSWERNAGEVARVLDELVRDERPSLILVSGDPIAESALLREASDAVREGIVRLSTGGRSDGISAAALAQAVDDALAAHRHQARAQIIDRFRQAEARQTLAVQGLGDVVEALGRAQTDHLLLHDDPLSDWTLWVGPDASQLAVSREELVEQGVAEPVRTRADSTFVWAALASGAEVTLLDLDDVTLTDGIGAILRWTDLSTPHDRLLSMPGHGEGPGGPDH